MVEVFKWFGTLSPMEGWATFIGLCLFMALIPYYGLIKRILIIYFTNESPEIIDFSWRIAPDYLIHQAAEKEYYYQPSQGMVYIGCPIILTWQVKGAYRIDINPDYAKLKQNTLITIIREKGNDYTLCAYTLKGKIEQKLSIPDELVVRLNTSHLGGANAFNQPESKVLASKLGKSKFNGRSYTTSHTFSLINKLVPNYKRMRVVSKRLQLKMEENPIKNEINSYIRKQKIVKGYNFNPSKYNKTLITENKLSKNKSNEREQ